MAHFLPSLYYFKLNTNFPLQTCGLCKLHDGSCPFLYEDIAWGAQYTEILLLPSWRPYTSLLLMSSLGLVSIVFVSLMT